MPSSEGCFGVPGLHLMFSKQDLHKPLIFSSAQKPTSMTDSPFLLPPLMDFYSVHAWHTVGRPEHMWLL